MRKSQTAIALFVSASSLASINFCAQAADDAFASVREQLASRVSSGERAASRGDWKTARKEFLEAIKLDPKCAVAYYDLGVAQAHLGQLSDAVQSEQKAVAIDPKFSDAYVELGWVLSQLGRFDDALAAEKRALEINPSNKAAAKNLEAIATARTDGGAANSSLAMPPAAGGAASTNSAARIRVAATAPTVNARPAHSQVDGLIAAGHAAFKKHELEVSRRYFEEALALQPDNSAAHAGLGVVLGSLGNIDAQIAEEKKAVGLDAKNTSALVNLGWALSKKQRWSEAVTAYQRALAISPNLLQAQVGQGLALFFSGKQEAGIAALRAAKIHGVKTAETHVALGTVLSHQGRTHEAEVELHEALRLSPGNVDAKEQLAKLMLEADKSEQAVKMFQDLVSQAPKNAMAHAGLSLALELKGDSSGAETEAKRALDLNPKLQLAQTTLDRLAQKKSTTK